MQRSTRLALAALALLLTLAPLGQAFGQQPSRFGGLLGHVPGDANVLVMLDIKSMRESLYVRNASQDLKPGQQHVNRYVFGAKELDLAVLAADLDLIEFIPLWETVVVATNVDPALPDLAGREGGRLEQLGRISAVWLPTNGYLVPFGPRLIGMRFPADRQAVSRWVGQSQQVVLTPYLRQAAGYPELAGTEIIMALDLENAVDPGAVRQRIAQAKTLEGKTVDLDRLSTVLASIRGVTLGILVDTNVNGSLRIDFGQDVTMMSDFAKPLILEKLSEFGAAIDEFDAWELRVEPNTLYLSGSLTPNGLRRVLSLIDPPTPSLAPADQEAAPAEGEPKVSPYKTQAYYKSIETLIDDVKDPDPSKIVGTGQVALWLDRYAKKIDQLPILGVDEQLVDFAGSISDAMRGLAAQYRGVGIEASKYSNNPRVQYYYGTNSWGGYGWGGGFYDRSFGVAGAEKEMAASTQAKRVGRANASTARAELWVQIDNDMAKVRREMTKRYQLEF